MESTAQAGREREEDVISSRRSAEPPAPGTRIALACLGAALATAGPAQAGPPLIADDPGTIGPGRVEWITTAQTAGRPDIDLFEGPGIDLTVGLLVGLDFVLVGTPTFVVEAGEETRTEANFNAGVKWRPIVTDHWAVAITPVLGLNILSGRNVYFYLPAQVEYRFGRGAVGVDGGYEFVRNDPDLWTAAAYGTWQATPSLLVLAEVWGLSRPGVDGEYGGGVGIDWTFRPGLALLAMAGTGFGSRGGPRVEWVGYLGVRWAFALWQPSPGRARPTLARALSVD